MDDNEIGARCARLQTMLASDALEPRPGRHDWHEHGEALQVVRGLVDELLPAAHSGDGSVVLALCAAAPLLHASGNVEPARRAVERAKGLVHDSTDSRILDEALWNMDRFTRLGHARWLHERGRETDAREVARRLALERAAPAIAEAARRIAERPKPLTRAPALATVNGFGVTIYGSRDRRDDGSYVTTRFFVALFLPILPLDAYRVIATGHRRYAFLEKVPLGAGARLWRSLVVAGVVVAGIGWGALTWWRSPTRRLHAALDQARTEERAAHDAASIARAEARYEKLIDDYSADVAPSGLEPAAEGIARLCSREVPARLGPGNVDIALRSVRHFGALPDELRRGAAGATMAASVSRWADSVSGADDRSLSAALELLDAGALAISGKPAARLVARRDAATFRFAERLRHDWPLAALRLYATLATKPEALRGAAAVIDKLDDDPSLWGELAPTLGVWVAGVQKQRLGDLEPLASRVEQRVQAARAQLAAPERKALLDSGDEAKLGDAAAEHPHDQGIGVARAGILRARGDAKGAIPILQSLGPPGSLTTQAALALAGAETDIARYADAEALLTHMLAQRMPAYRKARDRYNAKASSIEDNLIDQAKNDTLPKELSDRLDAVGDKQVRSEFHKIVGERMDADPELTELGKHLRAESDVVPIAVQLGTVQLRHAAEVGGDKRRRLLAAAERSFLSIEAGASGLPSFHLGLGQVYYRLGKTAEGDKELGQLLAGDDYDMHLDVARIYRSLGMLTRARQIVTRVYQAAPKRQRESAAMLMALMAVDLDDHELWLKRGDPDSDFVKVGLLEVEAARLVENGNRDQAADKLQQAARAYERDAKHEVSAANNAALDYSQRYLCTGNMGDLDAAARLFDGALALEPDAALVLNNAVPLLLYRARLAALSPWLRERELRLTDTETDVVFSAMLTGAHHKELVDRLTRNKDFARARQLLDQSVVLGPALPDAWLYKLGTLSMLKDARGLARLQARVGKVPALDLGGDEDALRDWLAGKHDAETRRQMAARLQQLDETAKALDAKRDAASVAAVELLEGDKHDDLAILGQSVREADASVTALRAADSTWPAIGARSTLARELVKLGLLRTAASIPAVGRLVKTDFREVGPSLLIEELLASHTSAALDALARDPALVEATALRRELAEADPRPSDWVLAELVHDPKLGELARPAFDDPVTHATAELESRLRPGREPRRWLALMKHGAKAY